ncbi:Target of rapamycin complex 2 subunit MAPKAP1 [Trichinella pseudospiralis]|uniref:Target of rapamycin complex 2 subunit MAPKAP1 n=1 Tax=Trichinella pseudospiralis TaxID=6337 RepID=A0A0V1IYI4_TRIPS|nr:Target of rapamycin complex 2 subunit MAPKAP1 [Trichinella pseudospiralis]KRZ36649.1 Target of rapamycin complex 2 subunit MAPKAP1 [Trichinella pseudospiralis]
MANWNRDDKMVSFIRFTFSTTDDSGLCADVLFDPIKTTKPGSHCSKTVVQNTSTDDPQVRFFSTFDASLRSRHRRRSNTLQRLEAMRQQREQNKRIAIVQWQPPPANAASSGEACPFVAVSVNDTTVTSTYSSASAAIKKTQLSNFNPFLDYLKFDESYSPQPSSKKVDVFLPFLDDCELRKVPVHVVMNGNAKVSDLIGLVCYIYTANNWNPPLIQDVNRYALYVAEDTGEVEYGLPARSTSERVNHFHFPFMAIAPRVEEFKENTFQQLLIHFDCGECITLPVSSSIQCLKTVRDKAVSEYFERCNVPKHKRLNYTLEKFDEPGQSVSLDATLSSVNCHEFFCVRVNSTRKGALVSESNGEDISPFPPFLSNLPAVEYTCDVIVIRPLRISTPAVLHVSSCSLTIIPKKLKSKVQLKCIPSFPRETHFLSALKRPVTIPIQKIRFVIRARINESQELMRIEYDVDTLVGQRQKFRLSFAMADMLANVFSQCAVPCRLAPTSILSRRSRPWKFSLLNRSTFVS